MLQPWKGRVLTAWPTGHIWWRKWDLNLWPAGYEPDALATELFRHLRLCPERLLIISQQFMLVNTFLKIFLSFFTSFFTALNSFHKVGKIGYFTITILFGGIACFFGRRGNWGPQTEIRGLGFSGRRPLRLGQYACVYHTEGISYPQDISYTKGVYHSPNVFLHLIRQQGWNLPLKGKAYQSFQTKW